MELKVWVEGIQRIVCGVTETTTCQVSGMQSSHVIHIANFEPFINIIGFLFRVQDVVFALAHATGKIGEYVCGIKFFIIHIYIQLSTNLCFFKFFSRAQDDLP